jgi:hypothetical protein
MSEYIGKDDLTLTQDEIDDLAKQVCSDYFRGDLLFQSKMNRDTVYNAAKHAVRLKRGSTGHQLLDPRYTVEGAYLPDKGLMNDYRHSFGNLYTLARLRTF